MKKNIKRIVFLGLCAFLFWYLFQTPSNTRDWSSDQQVLPYAEFKENTVAIHNIRNFTYRSTTDHDPIYYNKTFNLDELESVDYIVEPFGSIGAAHTFLSFGFKGEKYVAISIEIRKEKGEAFSAWKGILRQYELMYVIADERDAVKLRVVHRKDSVYIYPVKADVAKIKTLFIDMLTRANNLKEKPEFYNTLTNNCTTNIASHVNKITPSKIILICAVGPPNASVSVSLIFIPNALR